MPMTGITDASDYEQCFSPNRRDADLLISFCFPAAKTNKRRGVCKCQVVSVKVASVNITLPTNLAQIGLWKQFLV